MQETVTARARHCSCPDGRRPAPRSDGRSLGRDRDRHRGRPGTGKGKRSRACRWRPCRRPGTRSRDHCSCQGGSARWSVADKCHRPPASYRTAPLRSWCRSIGRSQLRAPCTSTPANALSNRSASRRRISPGGDGSRLVSRRLHRVCRRLARASRAASHRGRLPRHRRLAAQRGGSAVASSPEHRH